MKKLKKLVLLIALVSINYYPIPILAQTLENPELTCTIALNELMPNPKGVDTGNEWIELYNCQEEPVNLKNWYLVDKSEEKHFFQETTLDPNQFLIVEPSFGLNQTNEEVSLYNLENELIDSFFYESSKEDQSWARETDGIGEWVDTLPSTPAETNNIIYSQEIRINEVYPTPDSAQEENEWIELYNYSKDTINLDGWQISDNTKTQVLQDQIMLPDSYLVIQGTDLNLSLNNSGETLTLIDPNAETVFEFDYTSTKTQVSNIFWEDEITQTLKSTPAQINQYVPLDNCFYDKSYLPINSLKSIEELPPKFYTKGVLTSSRGQIYSDKAYIQDETGGLLIDTSKIDNFNYQIGNEISVYGEYSTYYKEPQLKILNNTCHKSQQNADTITYPISPNPIDQIGNLVSAKGPIVTNSAESFELEINPSQKIKISISNLETKITREKGDMVEITGILTRYGDLADGTANIRIVPRSIEDIIIFPKVNIPAKSKTSTKKITKKSAPKVKGANDQKTINYNNFKIPQINKKDIYPQIAVKKEAEKFDKTHKIFGANGLAFSLIGLFSLFTPQQPLDPKKLTHPK